MKFFLKWAALAGAVILASVVASSLGLPFKADVSSFASVMQIFVGVAVLSLLNMTVGNLLKLLTIPLNCLTLGAFSLVINAAMLLIVGQLDFGFKVGNFWAALVGGIFISIFNALLVTLIPDKKDKS